MEYKYRPNLQQQQQLKTDSGIYQRGCRRCSIPMSACFAESPVCVSWSNDRATANKSWSDGAKDSDTLACLGDIATTLAHHTDNITTLMVRS